MQIVREESFTFTTGTTERIWSPTSLSKAPRVDWFFSGSRWTIICKIINNFSSPILRRSLSAESKISNFIFMQISGLWGEDTCKKGEFESFMSKIFQMRDQVGFQDVPTRLQSCFGGAPSVDAHSEQISISFIIDYHHYVIVLHLKFISSHSQHLEWNLSSFFIR